MSIKSKLLISTILIATAHVSAQAKTNAVQSKYKNADPVSSDGLNLRFNVPAQPLRFGVGVDFKISDKWTLGPEADTSYAGQTNFGGVAVSGSLYSLGARAHWFNRGVFNSGIFLTAGARFQKLSLGSVKPDGISETKNQSGTVVDALFGYGWFWKSFNMMVGAGYLAYLRSPEHEYTYATADGGSFTAGRRNFKNGAKIDFSLGWTF